MPSLQINIQTFFAVLCVRYCYVEAFTVPSSGNGIISCWAEPTIFSIRRAISSPLFSELSESNETSDSSAELPATKSSPLSLPQAAPISEAQEEKDDDGDDLLSFIDEQSSSTTGTTAIFINQQTKRALIEELGYKRIEVDRLRPELAPPILSKRLSRPQEGVPDEWLLREDETANAMLEKLEKEQKYPLKFPLLAVSLVLFGKGLSDALITGIKVYTSFPGADLLVKETFMGVPVLGIDFICVVVGVALGSWTWNTMKD